MIWLQIMTYGSSSSPCDASMADGSHDTMAEATQIVNIVVKWRTGALFPQIKPSPDLNRELASFANKTTSTLMESDISQP